MTATRWARPPTTTSSGATVFVVRARAARWRRRRPLLLAVVAALVVIGLLGFALAGPVLVVRSVQVTGVSTQREAQVRAAAAVPAGRPLARVDTSAIGAQVRALPFVADVAVTRQWPSTVRLAVDVRLPAALVPRATGGYQVVDAAGVPFAAASKRLKGLPVVQVSLDDSARPALRAALDVLAALPVPLRSQVQGVTATSPSDVRLMVGKATVVWGSPDRSDRKVRVFAALRSTPAKVYDLSSPDTPVLR